MAILGVYQIFDESGTRDISKDERDICFNVHLDSPQADEDFLEASDGITTIPPVNSVIHGFRVKSKSWKRDPENPTFVQVTCKLDNALPELEHKPTGKEKTNVDIEVDVEPYEEAVYLDANLDPIVNTAGQPFSNQPTQTYYDQKIIVSFETGQVDQSNIDNCLGAINSHTVNMTVKGNHRSFAPKTLKFIDAPQKSKVIDGDYHWAMRYVFSYRPDTWIRKILNLGRMQKIDGDLKPIWLKGATAPCTEDVPLDKDGKAILDGALATAKKESEAGAGERCYREFQIEDAVNFGGLLAGIQ